jgi:hypothetical protein
MQDDELASLLAAPPAGEYAAYAGIGSRDTPAAICADMTRIAAALERRGLTLRSGGARGADAAFEAGTSEAREIYLPLTGWRGSDSALHPLTLGAAAWDEALAIAERLHPAWDRVRSDRARALLARDSFQILGRTLTSPSRFVLAWTPGGEDSGGTGQTIRIAQCYGVRVLNFHDEALCDAVVSLLA